MKPILFNTEMVKAILDDRKTQTRRAINLINKDLIFTGFIFSSTDKKREGCCSFGINKERDLEYVKPKYKVGDILWVREPAIVIENGNGYPYAVIEYKSDGKLFIFDLEKHPTLQYYYDVFPKWFDKKQGVPSGCIKEMARIFLKVTNVRVERLQDISEVDIWKEGIREINDCEMSYKCDAYVGYDEKEKAIESFKILWNSTAKDSYKWEDNPYVFVYEFERVENE